MYENMEVSAYENVCSYSPSLSSGAEAVLLRYEISAATADQKTDQNAQKEAPHIAGSLRQRGCSGLGGSCHGYPAGVSVSVLAAVEVGCGASVPEAGPSSYTWCSASHCEGEWVG